MNVVIDPKNTLTIAQMEICDVRTATLTGTAFDLQDYQGQVAITLMSDIGTGNADNTLNAKVQTSTTSGGSYSDISGAAFTEVTNAAGSTETILVDTRVASRWIRFVGTKAGTSPSFAYGVLITGQKRNE